MLRPAMMGMFIGLMNDGLDAFCALEGVKAGEKVVADHLREWLKSCAEGELEKPSEKVAENTGKGTPVSYGGTWAPDHTVRLATVPVGYGDGWPRSLSNKGYVLIRGQKAPIRGRVCMDQFMVEVTDIPDAAEGDEVTLIGWDGDAYISMEEVGDLSGRFNYELACDINPRVPRVCSITQ